MIDAEDGVQLDRVREFLAGLEALTAKTGLAIFGCGCCDSPWLSNVGDEAGCYVADEPSGERGAEIGNAKWVSLKELQYMRERRMENDFFPNILTAAAPSDSPPAPTDD